MVAKLQPGVRYDMPAMFGPSPAAEDEEGYQLHAATVSYVTSQKAALELVPVGFDVPNDPVVSISYHKCSGLNWMGGRDYNLVSVYISAIYRRGDHSIAAPFSLVIWESDCAPIIAGRDFMGTPKLFGQIPDADVGRESFEFHCSEYGNRLVTANVTEMKPVSASDLAAINKGGSNIVRLHWKYIPAPGGGADANYPVAMFAGSEYSRVWKGKGSFAFSERTRKEAPYSAHIIDVLAKLPVVRMKAATAVRASRVTLYRNQSVRLDIDPERFAETAARAAV